MSKLVFKNDNERDEYRYATRYGFEVEKKPLQFRLIGDEDWRDAHWCMWEWNRYEYRIKPSEVIKEVPVVPVLVNNQVVWVTTDKADALLKVGGKMIERFVTRNKVRTAIIKEVVSGY